MSAQSPAVRRSNLHRALAQVCDQMDEAVRLQLTILNPWSSDFREQAWAGVNDACLQAWPLLRKFLPHLPDTAVLQQAWAACFFNRTHLALLFRAGLAHEATTSEALRLRTLTHARWADRRNGFGDGRQADLVRFLMATSPAEATLPNLGPHTKCRGSIRLRYRVAHTCAQGAGLATILQVAANQPGATLYQRRVELLRAVKEANAQGRNWRRIGELEFSLLCKASQLLLLETPTLWPTALSAQMQALARDGEGATKLMAERERLDRVLAQLLIDVRARKFAEVEKGLAQVPDTPLARALCKGLKDQPWMLLDDTTHASRREEFGPWRPLSAASLQRLQAWAPAPLPAWWALSGPEFAARAARGEFDDPPGSCRVPVLIQDLAPMRRTWSVQDQEALIRTRHFALVASNALGWTTIALPELAHALLSVAAGRHEVLSRRLKALPDARPWLELMANAPDAATAVAWREMAQGAIETCWGGNWAYTWGLWTVQAYGDAGTGDWSAIEDMVLARTSPLKNALAMFHAKRQPFAPGAFQAVVARSLARPQQVPKKPLQAIKQWLHLDPLAAKAVADYAPVEWLDRLAHNPSTPLQALDVFMVHERVPAAARRRAWRNRIARTPNAQELTTLSAAMPSGIGHFKGLSQWLISGSPQDQTVSQVMVARRDARRLLQIRDGLCASVDARLDDQRKGEDRAEGDATARCDRDGDRDGDGDVVRNVEPSLPCADEAFRSACMQAAAHLRTKAIQACLPHQPSHLHDAAVLELVAHLGADSAPSLMQALAQRDHSSPPGCRLDASYTFHTVPKRNGGQRVIHAPQDCIKRVQRAVLDKLLTPLGHHPAACGFVPGMSVVHNAQPHVGQAVVVNADIRNCFPSVRWPLVLGVLRRELGGRLPPQAISLLVDLLTAQGALPVGAPTSPALLNLVLRRTDERLHAHAIRLGAQYTRYADDLTFSGDHRAVGLLRLAERTLSGIGLELDPRKTNIFRRGRRQMVTGLAVNDQVSVPRAVRRRLRAAVHRVEQGELSHWDGHDQDEAALQGRLAFVSMVQPAQAAPLMKRLSAARMHQAKAAADDHSAQPSMKKVKASA